MITKEQAIALGNGTLRSEIHCETVHKCKRIVGPRGGVKDYIVRVRVSGRCQTWKTRPREFRLPVKYRRVRKSAITHRTPSGSTWGRTAPSTRSCHMASALRRQRCMSTTQTLHGDVCQCGNAHDAVT